MFRYLLLFLFVSTITLAQRNDSLRNGRVNMDSVRYTNLKIRMSKTKFSRSIYRLLFRDVYNQGKKGRVKAIETNPFTPYEGMVIRKIIIKQLDVLGESVYDTTRVGKQIDRFLSKNFHTNTRERIIRKSFLRFSEGDEIQASVLRDNERLLRKNGTITDATDYCSAENRRYLDGRHCSYYTRFVVTGIFRPARASLINSALVLITQT